MSGYRQFAYFTVACSVGHNGFKYLVGALKFEQIEHNIGNAVFGHIRIGMNAYSVQLILYKLVNRHTLRNAFQRIENNRVMRYYKIGFVRHCLFYHSVGYVKAKAYTLNRGIHITDKKSAVVKLILHRKRCVFIQKLVDSAYFHNLHPKKS